MPAKLDKCVKSVMKQKMDKFIKDNGKQPSKAQRDKMRSSAFAICNSQTSCLTGELKG